MKPIDIDKAIASTLGYAPKDKQKGFSKSLDKMHKAESQLCTEYHALFRDFLAVIVGFDSELSPTGARAYVSATALQRAEAYLRVYNLWID